MNFNSNYTITTKKFSKKIKWTSTKLRDAVEYRIKGHNFQFHVYLRTGHSRLARLVLLLQALDARMLLVGRLLTDQIVSQRGGGSLGGGPVLQRCERFPNGLS